MTDERLAGTITALGTSSGHRLVVGAWQESPIGRFADVMWALPDGTRRLLAPDDHVASYVAGIYRFEETEIVDFKWRADPRSLEIVAGPIEITAAASGGGRVRIARPWWFTRGVEGPIARRWMGVATHGVSPLGVEEWYQARAWRWINDAQVRIHGELNDIAAPRPPLGVGFSEPPLRPSITDVRVRVRRH